MTIRILADREPYASYADLSESGRSKGPSGPFFISVGPIADEEPPPDLVAMPVEHFLSLAPARRSGSVVIAYGEVSGMEQAFALGCSDYMRVPWSIRELAARAVRLDVPRAYPGNVEIALVRDQLRSPGAAVRLNESERRLARLLMLNSGYAVSREALGYATRGTIEAGAHAIESHISSLRTKFDTLIPGSGSMIKAARGLGYRLTY